MATMSISIALTAYKDIGRGLVFYSTESAVSTVPKKWVQADELFLRRLCETHGVIEQTPNTAMQNLTAPELTGEAPLKSYAQGEAPVLTVPMFNGNPDLRKVCSETYNASAGYPHQIPVRQHTVVIMPQQLFFNAAADPAKYDLVLDPNGGAWTMTAPLGSPVALTTEQTRLLGLSVWIWKAHWRKAAIQFAHDDGGRAVGSSDLVMMIDEDMPEGHQLYTVGDPYDAGIDIEGGS